MPKQWIIKLNLGRGLVVTPNWYNIDGVLRAFFSTWPINVLKSNWLLQYFFNESKRDYYT
jgi:hypothetical protein